MADRLTEGRKSGGLRFDLLPVDALAEVAYVYTAGAQKYEDRNWEKGYKWSLSIRALVSHLYFFLAGEDRDPETGSLHIAQVVWHGLALLTFYLRGIGDDDRAENQQTVRALYAVRERPIPTIERFTNAVQVRPSSDGPSA
jgi:hypothetical protein